MQCKSSSQGKRHETERLQEELQHLRQALRESEEIRQSLFERSLDIIYIHDTKGRFIDANNLALNLFGYSREKLSSINISSIICPEHLPRARRNIRDLLDTGIQKRPSVYRMLCKGGDTIWLETNTSVLYRNGKPYAVQGTARDISERKEAEDRLRQSEQSYKNIIETIQEAYYEVDLHGNFTFFNPSVYTKLGYSDEELTGVNFRDYMSEEDASKVLEAYHHVYVTGEPILSIEFAAKTRAGGIIPVEASVSLRKTGNNEVSGFKGVVRDITERKEAEKALRKSEERFRDLAKMLPETIFESDMDGRITFANKSGMKHFGFEEKDLESGFNIKDMVAPKEKQKMQENLTRLFRGENPGLGEYQVVRKDGSTFPVLAHSSLIVRNGKPMGLRGFLVDITEKKNLESLLLHAQRMESLGTLAGGIAHDFNNLMMGILGNISIMMMSIDEENAFYKRLKNMEDYVKRGSELTKQLLGFARGGKYEPKVTDIREFVRGSTDMFARTRKEIRIHTRVSKNVWPVEVDQGQLEQVLLNLYLNAWQAMPGGGDLYVGVKNAGLSEKTASLFGLFPGKYVRVAVRDTGVGMDKQTKARIFDPFFTTKELGRGTGLGLASVYGIVNNHGGSIMVESEAGIGTEFLFFLPASSKKIEREVVVKEEVKKGIGCVLLVDDEEMILNVGRDMIAGLGYRVVVAEGGTTGLKEYQKRMNEIDLVILDMIMPDLGGREVFSRLKELNPQVRVILSSGYSLDGQAKEIMDQGCTGFIQKPFSLQNLSRKICEALERI